MHSDILRLLSCLCALALGACSPLPGPAVWPPAPRSQSPQAVLRLKLPVRVPARFQILSPAQPADVAALRFCLIQHPLGSPPVGQSNVTPLGSVFEYDLSAETAELQFINLAANASGYAYSVAVAAFDAQGQNITNQTGDNAQHQRLQISGESGNFYLSSSGGDPDYPGSVRVLPGTYTLSGSQPLSVALKLADG